MRYEIAPHYDLWMQGARFGSEVKTDRIKDRRTGELRTRLHLRMERTGRVAKFWYDECTPI